MKCIEFIQGWNHTFILVLLKEMSEQWVTNCTGQISVILFCNIVSWQKPTIFQLSCSPLFAFYLELILTYSHSYLPYCFDFLTPTFCQSSSWNNINSTPPPPPPNPPPNKKPLFLLHACANFCQFYRSVNGNCHRKLINCVFCRLKALCEGQTAFT